MTDVEEQVVVRDGRWCGCGGEFTLSRRMEDCCIVTYLVCPFCRARKPSLRYDTVTRELTDLLRCEETS